MRADVINNPEYEIVVNFAVMDCKARKNEGVMGDGYGGSH